MARLLFVDDEPAMLFALQRLAEKLKHEPVLPDRARRRSPGSRASMR